MDKITVDCWQCGGFGMLAGCFEDTCCCTGDPDDAESCCAPSRCDICQGNYELPVDSDAAREVAQ